jgi:hypothetical protein
MEKTQVEDVVTKTVEAIMKAHAYRRGAWVKVIEESRKYAMMKTHGKYIENGKVITVSYNDRQSYEDLFKGNLLRYAEDAFLEDALVGQEVPD